MSNCKIYQDYDKRAVFGKDKVVHAAKTLKYRGRSNLTSNGWANIDPIKKEGIITACGKTDVEWNYDSGTYESFITNLKEIEHDATITCKHCQMALGIRDNRLDEYRYVLIEKESGYYFRKRNYADDWVQNVFNATLYKTKSAAKNGGKITEFFNDSHEKISMKKYFKLPKAVRFSVSRFNCDKYEVKRVKLVLID